MDEFFAKFGFGARNEGLIGVEFEVIITSPEGLPSDAGFEILKEVAGMNGAPYGEWDYADGVIGGDYLAGRLQPAFQRGQFKPELFLEQVEYNTKACGSLEELEKDLGSGYRSIIEMAGKFGTVVNFSGLPLLDGESPRIFPTARYRSIKKRVTSLMMGFTNSIHLHAGVVSADEGVYMLNVLRTMLPQFLFLSANSAVGHGKLYDAASQRFIQHASFVKQLIPPHINGKEHYARLMREQGNADDPDSCWWVIRLNPVGSLELRILDGQDRLEEAMFLIRIWSAAVSYARGMYRRQASLESASIGYLMQACLQVAGRGLRRGWPRGAMDSFIRSVGPYLDGDSCDMLENITVNGSAGLVRQNRLWEKSGTIPEYLKQYAEIIAH